MSALFTAFSAPTNRQYFILRFSVVCLPISRSFHCLFSGIFCQCNTQSRIFIRYLYRRRQTKQHKSKVPGEKAKKICRNTMRASKPLHAKWIFIKIYFSITFGLSLILSTFPPFGCARILQLRPRLQQRAAGERSGPTERERDKLRNQTREAKKKNESERLSRLQRIATVAVSIVSFITKLVAI